MCTWLRAQSVAWAAGQAAERETAMATSMVMVRRAVTLVEGDAEVVVEAALREAPEVAVILGVDGAAAARALAGLVQAVAEDMVRETVVVDVVVVAMVQV